MRVGANEDYRLLSHSVSGHSDYRLLSHSVSGRSVFIRRDTSPKQNTFIEVVVVVGVSCIGACVAFMNIIHIMHSCYCSHGHSTHMYTTLSFLYSRNV